VSVGVSLVVRTHKRDNENFINICTDVESNGYLNPIPCHCVKNHLLNKVNVILIEYHRKVSDEINKIAITAAFALLLLRIKFP
jgi:hypothetical protein